MLDFSLATRSHIMTDPRVEAERNLSKKRGWPGSPPSDDESCALPAWSRPATHSPPRLRRDPHLPPALDPRDSRYMCQRGAVGNNAKAEIPVSKRVKASVDSGRSMGTTSPYRDGQEKPAHPKTLDQPQWYPNDPRSGRGAPEIAARRFAAPVDTGRSGANDADFHQDSSGGIRRLNTDGDYERSVYMRDGSARPTHWNGFVDDHWRPLQQGDGCEDYRLRRDYLDARDYERTSQDFKVDTTRRGRPAQHLGRGHRGISNSASGRYFSIQTNNSLNRAAGEVQSGLEAEDDNPWGEYVARIRGSDNMRHPNDLRSAAEGPVPRGTSGGSFALEENGNCALGKRAAGDATASVKDHDEVHELTDDSDDDEEGFVPMQANAEEELTPEQLVKIPKEYRRSHARIALLREQVRRNTPNGEELRLDLLSLESIAFTDGSFECSFASSLQRAVYKEVQAAKKRAGGRRRRMHKSARNMQMRNGERQSNAERRN